MKGIKNKKTPPAPAPTKRFLQKIGGAVGRTVKEPPVAVLIAKRRIEWK